MRTLPANKNFIDYLFVYSRTPFTLKVTAKDGSISTFQGVGYGEYTKFVIPSSFMIKDNFPAVFNYEADGEVTRTREVDLVASSTPGEQVPGPPGDDGEDGIDGEQGPPGIVWVGVYDNQRTYGKGDGVFFSGRSFVAKTGTMGAAPPSSATSTATWQIVADKGQDGATGGGGSDSMAKLFGGGETTYDRNLADQNGITLTSGRIIFGNANLATVTEQISHVSAITGGTSMAGTTYAGYAVYSVSDTGTLTKVAQTANDTANLWNVNFQGFLGINTKKAFITPFTKTAGVRYVVGALFVGTTAPQLGGKVVGVQDTTSNYILPFRAARMDNQTGFPDSIARESMTGHSHAPIFGLFIS